MTAAEILGKCKAKNLKLAFAESLTGGQLCAEFVKVAGASEVVLGSVVAYQTGLKSSLLGVNSELLAEVGAVDPEVALKMAEGVRSRLALGLMIATDEVIGISTTGVAGPDSQDGKPVGLVYIAMSSAKGEQVWEEGFAGDRNSIRSQVVDRVISRLGEFLG